MWQPLQFNSNVSSHLRRWSLCSSSTFFCFFAEVVHQSYSYEHMSCLTYAHEEGSSVLYRSGLKWVVIIPAPVFRWEKYSSSCGVCTWVNLNHRVYPYIQPLLHIFTCSSLIQINAASLLPAWPSFRLIPRDYFTFFPLGSDLYVSSKTTTINSDLK